MARYRLLALVLLLCVWVPSAQAYYDDVHYALSYAVSRYVGLTPEQAYRLASACVSVDWEKEVEPVQMGRDSLVALLQNPTVSAPALGPIGTGVLLDASVFFWGVSEGSIVRSRPNMFHQLEQSYLLPGAVDTIAKEQAFQHILDAQWRFHAFRDAFRYPDYLDDGQGNAARTAVTVQRETLFKAGVQSLNPGIFLHFFQDEVPHRGYAVGGGHWILPPEIKLPMGGTTDWLNFRSLESNQDLVKTTAERIILFLRETSARQEPLRTADDVVQLLTPDLELVRLLNEPLEEPPERMRDVRQVLYSKWLADRHEKGHAGTFVEEIEFSKHADGPNFPGTVAILSKQMRSRGMEPLPEQHQSLGIRKYSSSAAAYFTDFDASVLLGSLTVRVLDTRFGKDGGGPKRPDRLEVIVRSVPDQEGAEAYTLDSAVVFGPSAGALQGGHAFEFTGNRLPVGELDVEVLYDGQRAGGQRVLLQQAHQECAVPVGGAGDGTAPVGGRPFVWVLTDTSPVFDHKGHPLTKAVGRKKDYWQQHSFQLSETRGSLHYLNYYNNRKEADYRASITWTPPPAVLQPGEELAVSMTHGDLQVQSLVDRGGDIRAGFWDRGFTTLRVVKDGKEASGLVGVKRSRHGKGEPRGPMTSSGVLVAPTSGETCKIGVTFGDGGDTRLVVWSYERKELGDAPIEQLRRAGAARRSAARATRATQPHGATQAHRWWHAWPPARTPAPVADVEDLWKVNPLSPLKPRVLEEIEKVLRRWGIGIQLADGALSVSSVEPQSTGETLLLRSGDRVTELNGRAIAELTAADWDAAVAAAETARVTIRRADGIEVPLVGVQERPSAPSAGGSGASTGGGPGEATGARTAGPGPGGGAATRLAPESFAIQRQGRAEVEVEGEGRMRIAVSGNQASNAHLWRHELMAGDYALEIDYLLSRLPTGVDAMMYFRVGLANAETGRAHTEVLASILWYGGQTHFAAQHVSEGRIEPLSVIPTNSREGRFKIERRGSRVTVHYVAGGRWQKLGEAQIPAQQKTRLVIQVGTDFPQSTRYGDGAVVLSNLLISRDE